MKTDFEAMKLEDIHPDDFTGRVEELLDRDMEKLSSMYSRFEVVYCPCCEDHGDHTEAFSIDRFRYLRCKACGLVYLSPRPTLQIMREFLDKSEGLAFIRQNVRGGLAKSRIEKLYLPRVQHVQDFVERNDISTGIILEIGSGDGIFGCLLNDTGLFDEIWLLDPTAPPPPRSSDQRVNVIFDTIESADLPGDRGDIVLAFEVLEHLCSPSIFLGKVHRFLRSGGYLHLTTPNFDGYEIQVLGSLSTSVGWDHLNYFNIHSLRQFLENGGFDVITLETPGELDMQMIRRKVRDDDGLIRGNISLQYLLGDGWEINGHRFQEYLIKNKLSSHMTCLARKR